MKKILITISLCFTILLITLINKQYTNIMNQGAIPDPSKDLAFYIKDQEEYILSNEIPLKTDGYRFSHAECNDSSSIIWNYSAWAPEILNMDKGEISCKLYFDKEKMPAKEYILDHITTISSRDSFDTILTTSTTGIIYEGEDDYGLTYYYAGAPTDNYFQFGGYWWRIIRINGDGTIRLIYAGTISDYSVGLTNGYDDSTTLYETIGSFAFHTLTNGQRYIGYYSEASNLHGISDSSNIVKQLNTWYQQSLLTYNEYISDNTLFCNDRTAYIDEFGIREAVWSDVPLYYGAYIRLQTKKEPTFKCANNLDAFTTSNTNNYNYEGNGVLTYPIGLITADEVAFAGGLYNTPNNQYYLYTNTISWTMSPAKYEDGDGREWQIGAPGGLNYSNGLITSPRQTRPVINLRADITLTGTGTSTDPYRVSGA